MKHSATFHCSVVEHYQAAQRMSGICSRHQNNLTVNTTNVQTATPDIMFWLALHGYLVLYNKIYELENFN
jgi:hypothetical protein